MNRTDRFDDVVSDWLRQDAEHRVPEHLDAVLRRTATERQRPAWSSLERWLPMETTIPVRRYNRPGLGRIALAVLLIALIGSILAVVASQRRLPEPFGLARNGAIAMSHDGDIYTVDPVTHATRVLVGGPAQDFGPSFSRDGTKILLLRAPAEPAPDPAVDPGLTLVVADADGSNPHDVTPAVFGLDWLDWSPDSKQITFLSRKTPQGPGLINVVNVDGTGLTTLDVGRPAHFISWLPPLGREIVFRAGKLLSSDPVPAIWAVHPDGTGLRQLSVRPAENDDDYGTPAVSPDGTRISYWSSTPISPGSDTAVAHIHVLDLTSGQDIVLPDPTDGFTNQFGTAYFSPDGRLVGYVRDYSVDSTYQFVVAPSDGSGTGTPIGPRLAQPFGDVNYAWVPDGTAVAVDYDRDQTARLLPIDGSQGSILGTGALSFADVQRLAP
ncbi:MAG: TolB family protein [Chloroflexota bacterium]